MPKKITLKLFDRVFELATSDGNSEDLLKVAHYYKKVTENLKKLHPKRPELEIAVLAGLRITDELYNLLKKYEQNKDDSVQNNSKDTIKVNDLINQALKELELSLKL